MNEFTICEYNVENLFLSMTYYRDEDLATLAEDPWNRLALAQHRRRQKPIVKIRELAKVIREINADVVMLVEVGGEESLQNFTRYFLNDEYTAYFVHGNSKREIDLGFLVKKDFPLRVEARSNKELPIYVKSYQRTFESKFSRDVAELRIFDHEDRLKMILMLVHLKSKISSDHDFKGADIRSGEANALAQLYQKHRDDYPDLPIVVAGDFNSELLSPEFEAILETDLSDMHDVLKTPEDQQYSLVHFDYKKVARPQTLDYILISPELIASLDSETSRVHRYASFYDIPNEPPRDRKERYKMPSDHYPLVARFKNLFYN